MLRSTTEKSLDCLRQTVRRNAHAEGTVGEGSEEVRNKVENPILSQRMHLSS